MGEYDALASGSPEWGALLRREGFYSSHLAEWRKARDVAVREGLVWAAVFEDAWIVAFVSVPLCLRRY